eukprot:4966755-Prymnesium_polylepis.1
MHRPPRPTPSRRRVSGRQVDARRRLHAVAPSRPWGGGVEGGEGWGLRCVSGVRRGVALRGGRAGAIRSCLLYTSPSPRDAHES